MTKLFLRRHLLGLGVAWVLVSTTVIATSQNLQVAEVSVPASVRRDVEREVKQAMKRTVSRMDTARVKGGPYLVSAALLRLETKKGDYGMQSTAVIHTSLRHKQSGSLLAMTEGRATATDLGGDEREAEGSAVRAAVESALEGVPAALGRK